MIEEKEKRKRQALLPTGFDDHFSRTTRFCELCHPAREKAIFAKTRGPRRSRGEGCDTLWAREALERRASTARERRSVVSVTRGVRCGLCRRRKGLIKGHASTCTTVTKRSRVSQGRAANN